MAQQSTKASSSRAKSIALDTMGGDLGPAVAVEAADRALKRNSHLKIHLVGDKAQLTEAIKGYPSMVPDDRYTIVHAAQTIDMEDEPVWSYRHKPNASMRVALELLAQNKVQACVSPGNTGALAVLSHLILKTWPGLARSALVIPLPTLNRTTYLLDVGANVDAKPDHLYQFAQIGQALAKASDQIEKPSVGLLNIGSESVKGTSQLQLAAKQLKQNSALNYRGFVEGSDVFKGDVDIIVCEGMVGNVAIKTSESLSQLFVNLLATLINNNAELKSLIKEKWRKAFYRHLNPERYNGALLAGVNGIVIKSHGHAHAQMLFVAIEKALNYIEQNTLENLKSEFAKLTVINKP